MATLTSIPYVSSFFTREQPTSAKFTSDIRNKMNSLIDNHVLINDHLKNLLQGASGGLEQAKIPLGITSAPTGWTRDIVFATDQILRVTDGVTVPSGISPTAIGGSSGGNWTLSGITLVAVGNHTHVMTHTHTMQNHTHSVAGHYHSSDHVHTANHTHVISVAYQPSTHE